LAKLTDGRSLWVRVGLWHTFFRMPVGLWAVIHLGLVAGVLSLKIAACRAGPWRFRWRLCWLLVGGFGAACTGRASEDSPGRSVQSPDGAAAVSGGQGSPCAPRPVPDSFVRIDRGRLVAGANAFLGAGVNLYYLPQLYAEAESGNIRAETAANEVLDSVACLGFEVVRMWAFHDGSQTAATIRSGPGLYQTAGLRGLDRAVAEARARGIRLILTLTNNWPEYGGLHTLAEWAGRSHKDAFFFDETARAPWHAYAALLARRQNVFTGVTYAREPAILAWELGNEFRCERCLDARRLVMVVDELATTAQRLFPHHLIADGGEGFDDDPRLYRGLSNRYPVSGALRASYHRLARLESLDLLSYHLYPEHWGLNAAGDARIWIRRHEEIARKAGKVAYLGEYGVARPHLDPAAEARRAADLDAWLAELYASSGGLFGLFWQLVPSSRANSDNFEIRHPNNRATLAVMKKWLDVAALH